MAEETALLVRAQAALRDGDATRALELLDRHAQSFPSGYLSEEREAARVLALCKAGRGAEPRSAADGFVAAHPRSPSVSRVRAACTSE